MTELTLLKYDMNLMVTWKYSLDKRTRISDLNITVIFNNTHGF